MKKIFTLVALLLLVWVARNEFATQRPDPAGTQVADVGTDAGTEAIAAAYADKASGLQVTGAGVRSTGIPDSVAEGQRAAQAAVAGL